MSPTAIFWYRRDLRLNDVHGLYQALKQHESVLLIFIFDPEILDCLPKDDARVDFIYHRLKDLNIALSKHRTAIHTILCKPKGSIYFNNKTIQHQGGVYQSRLRALCH